MRMKQRIRIIGAAVLAALCFFLAIMEIPVQAAGTIPSYTVTEILPCYVETTAPVPVYTEPFFDAEAVGTAPEEVVFLVLGITDNGWYQVRYLGKKCYITPANLIIYAGGEKETAMPALSRTGGYMVNFLGDSITYGDKLTNLNQSYAALLAVMMNASVYRNYGLKGSCMGGEHPDRFWDRYSEMSDDANLVFVMGGTNDYEFSTPLGQFGDTSTKTFYGVVNLLMCSLQQKYPDAQIVFLTPLRRYRGTAKNADGHNVEDYVNAMMVMGEFYDIPVIDLYHANGLNFVGSRNDLVDGLHPTAAGHRKIANYIYQTLFTAP